MEIFIASMIALTAVMIYACILSAKLEKRLVEAQKERRKMQTRIINDRRYARDKPADCAYCYFWKANKKCCSQTECYYLLSAQDPDSSPQTSDSSRPGKSGDCKNCAYGRHSPCIGYCIKKLILEMKQKKQDRTKKQSK